MPWADKYCCKSCGNSFVWPWGFRNAYYLLPTGDIFKLESQLGWCCECDRPSYFEKLGRDDLAARLQIIQRLRQDELLAIQPGFWRVLYQWTFRRKIAKARAMADAYSRLAEQEQRRGQYLAGRSYPRCYCCEHEAGDDAFAEFDPLKCQSCGGTLEVSGDSWHFKLSNQSTYYTASGRKADANYWQQYIPRIDDIMMQQARTNYELAWAQEKMRQCGWD